MSARVRWDQVALAAAVIAATVVASAGGASARDRATRPHSSTPLAVVCLSPNLSVGVQRTRVAFGTAVVPVTFTNEGTGRCVLAGYPRLAVWRTTLPVRHAGDLGRLGAARAIGAGESAVLFIASPASCVARWAGETVPLAIALPKAGQKVVQAPAGLATCPLTVSRFGVPGAL